MPSRRSRVTRSREIALAVLGDVSKGRFAEHALAQRLGREKVLSPEDRNLATELVYGVLRWQDRLDDVINRCSDHPQRRIMSQIREILRLGMYQILLLDRIPDHAAVDQAVTQTQERFGSRAAAFVNAILRRALRDRESVDPPPVEDAESLARYYSHPQWLVTRWFDELGPDRTRRVLIENNARPPLVARVNRLKSTAEELTAMWKAAGVEVEPVPFLPDALFVLTPGRPVHALPGYEQGLFVVQDPASQMVAPLLGVQPGDRVLDACAAPGGKTSHLAALGSNTLEIVAVDRDPARLEEAKKNLERLAVRGVAFARGDASDLEFIEKLGTFDRVLVDAPCTNLGVLRRNPEARYRARCEDPAEFARIQLGMLAAVARIVKPGGTLVYSVCTVSREETRQVIEDFMNAHDDYVLLPIEPRKLPLPGLATGAFFSTFPPPGGILVDGFFAARFGRHG